MKFYLLVDSRPSRSTSGRLTKTLLIRLTKYLYKEILWKSRKRKRNQNCLRRNQKNPKFQFSHMKLMIAWLNRNWRNWCLTSSPESNQKLLKSSVKDLEFQAKINRLSLKSLSITKLQSLNPNKKSKSQRMIKWFTLVSLVTAAKRMTLKEPDTSVRCALTSISVSNVRKLLNMSILSSKLRHSSKLLSRFLQSSMKMMFLPLKPTDIILIFLHNLKICSIMALILFEVSLEEPIVKI